MLKLVVQEPQFLPFPGLWHKMLSCDKYVINAGVKFDKADHQHRVTLNGKWITLPLEGGQRSDLIKDVRLSADSQQALVKMSRTIMQTLMTKKNPYGHRLSPIVTALETLPSGGWLIDVNQQLMLAMMATLGLVRDVRTDTQPRWELDKTNRLDQTIFEHSDGQAVMYLAGAGGRNYMGFDTLSRPAAVRFQVLKSGCLPDTAMQLIANEVDPLAVIRECASWEAWDGRRFKADNETLED